MNNSFPKLASLFLIGIILGFFIGKINIEPPRDNEVTTYNKNSVVRAIGNPKAKVMMVEYTDFQCPLCKSFYDQSFKTLKTEYIDTGKVYYVVKHFPLQIHPYAPAAAMASDCALAQGKFAEYHDLLFEKQNDWANDTGHINQFKQFAANLQLDTEKFNGCLDNKEPLEQVKADYMEGISKSISGTPSFYINDTKIIGAKPWPEFKTALDKALE